MSRIIKTSFADDGDDRTLGRLADALEQREPELRKVIGQPENPDVTPALNDGQEWISNLPAMPPVPGPNQKTAMFMQAPDLSVVLRGGPGSGHFGHTGRPGKQGGSQPSDFHEAMPVADDDIPALAEAEYQATASGFEKHLFEKYGEAEPRRATWIGPSGKFLVQDGDHQGTAIELMGWESPSDPKEGEPITKEWENRGFKATNEVVEAGLIRFNFDLDIIAFDIASDGKVTEDQRIAMATLVEGEAARDEMWPYLRISIGGPFFWNTYTEERTLTDDESYDFIGLDRPTGLRSYVRPVERGGPGSGHFGHKGIPEHRGGSQPGDFHSSEKAGEKKRVGITSSRPGKPNAQVFEEMRQFKDRLLALPTVANAEVEPGLGGWQDETGQIVREPTWVVSYEGNGEAQALLEETAKQYEQDAVLVMGGADGEDAPMSRIVFGDNVTPEERDAIQTSAAKHGFAGWTWYRDEQGRAVMELVTVPQWGGDVGKHVLNAAALSNDIRDIGQPSEISNQSVKVSVVETRKTMEPPDLHEGETTTIGEEGNVHGFYRLSVGELDVEREKYGVEYRADKIRTNPEGFVKMAQDGPAPDLKSLKFNATNPSPAFGSEAGGWTEFQFENPEKNVYVQMGEENGLEVATIEALIPGRGGGTEVIHSLRDWADLTGGMMSVWRITNPKFFEKFKFWTRNRIRDGQSADYVKWDYRRQQGIEERSILTLTRRLVLRGGPGSGHYGHEGRPGKVGGSAPSSGHPAFGWPETKPWEASREDIEQGKVPGLAYDPSMSPGIVAHYYNKPNITVGPLFFEGEPFGRQLLMYHELGHAVATSIIASWGDVTQIPFLRPFLNPDFEHLPHDKAFDNFVGFSGRPEEFLADVYSDLVHGGRSGWESKKYHDVYDAVAQAAADLLLPSAPQYAYDTATKGWVKRGGPGSGHFGHEGRPGQRGGSQPSDFHSAEGEGPKPGDLVDCPRCGGKGHIPSYEHVAEGVCFQCGGAKKVPFVPAKEIAGPDPEWRDVSARIQNARAALAEELYLPKPGQPITNPTLLDIVAPDKKKLAEYGADPSKWPPAEQARWDRHKEEWALAAATKDRIFEIFGHESSPFGLAGGMFWNKEKKKQDAFIAEVNKDPEAWVSTDLNKAREAFAGKASRVSGEQDEADAFFKTWRPPENGLTVKLAVSTQKWGYDYVKGNKLAKLWVGEQGADAYAMPNAQRLLDDIGARPVGEVKKDASPNWVYVVKPLGGGNFAMHQFSMFRYDREKGPGTSIEEVKRGNWEWKFARPYVLNFIKKNAGG